MANSPFIKDGALSLTSTGDLISALDIATQMTVAISGYDCIYDSDLNSQLIPYLTTIPVGGLNRNAITNIVVQAYNPMVVQGIISNLGISIPAQTLSTINIQVNATDAQGNEISLNWTNP